MWVRRRGDSANDTKSRLRSKRKRWESALHRYGGPVENIDTVSELERQLSFFDSVKSICQFDNLSNLAKFLRFQMYGESGNVQLLSEKLEPCIGLAYLKTGRKDQLSIETDFISHVRTLSCEEVGMSHTLRLKTGPRFPTLISWCKSVHTRLDHHTAIYIIITGTFFHRSNRTTAIKGETKRNSSALISRKISSRTRSQATMI
jgi:hypothetical protein